ncbi:hypothetical protein Tco_0122129 [Tanacetum coccineum]
MFTPPATYSVETRFEGVTDWYQSQISSDSSDESVESSISRIILFGTILTEIPTETPVVPPVAPEAEVAIVASPAGVLDLIMYSFTDSDSSDDLPSPEHVSNLPATSPFLCTDSSEASSDSSDSESSDRPLSPDSHATTIARWRSKVALYSSSSETLSPTHDLPPALCQIVPALLGIPHQHGILVLPGQ